VWLSHAGRDRVTVKDNRARWMDVNGAGGSTLLVDGWLEGLWRIEDGKPVVIGTFRKLSRAEQRELEGEFARVEALLEQ